MWRQKILETKVVDNFKKTVISNAAEQLLIQIGSDQAKTSSQTKHQHRVQKVGTKSHPLLGRYWYMIAAGK